MIFTLLALGLAMAWNRQDRAGADRGLRGRVRGAELRRCGHPSPRAVAAYVVPPLFLALVVDRVVAVVRRHVLGRDERSVWATVGWPGRRWRSRLGLVDCCTCCGWCWPRGRPAQACAGVVLNAAPLPADPECPAIEPPDVEPPELAGASKKARLAWWYERDPDYGNRSAVAAVAKRLAPKVDLAEGTARAYLGQICADLEKAGEAS